MLLYHNQMANKKFDLMDKVIDTSLEPRVLKENITRRKIFTLLIKKPRTITELKKEIGIAYNNLFAHLRKLEKAGIVALVKTKEKNNPTYVMPLLQKYQDISFEETHKILGSNRKNLKAVYVEMVGNLSFKIEEIFKQQNKIEKILPKNIQLNFLTSIKGNMNGKPKIKKLVIILLPPKSRFIKTKNFKRMFKQKEIKN